MLFSFWIYFCSLVLINWMLRIVIIITMTSLWQFDGKWTPTANRSNGKTIARQFLFVVVAVSFISSSHPSFDLMTLIANLHFDTRFASSLTHTHTQVRQYATTMTFSNEIIKANQLTREMRRVEIAFVCCWRCVKRVINNNVGYAQWFQSIEWQNRCENGSFACLQVVNESRSFSCGHEIAHSRINRREKKEKRG